MGRFIPTCVGFTNNAFIFFRVSPGSSPRVWGLLTNSYTEAEWDAVHPHVCGVYAELDKAVPALRRFIPTCVGFTLKSS